MPDRAAPRPRWSPCPCWRWGRAGFAAVWMLLALALDRQCSWLALLAALDMALLLRLALAAPAGGTARGWRWRPRVA